MRLKDWQEICLNPSTKVGFNRFTSHLKPRVFWPGRDFLRFIDPSTVQTRPQNPKLQQENG